jgi:hypothetical protein
MDIGMAYDGTLETPKHSGCLEERSNPATCDVSSPGCAKFVPAQIDAAFRAHSEPAGDKSAGVIDRDG